MIAHYESSEGDPTIEILKDVAAALNVTVSYLVGESPQKLVRDELTPKLRKHVQKLQKLPPKDQKAVMRHLDGLAVQNGITIDEDEASKQE